MTVGDETCTVGSGDAILIPRNKVHSLANTGLSVMKIVLVCGPAFSRADENFLDVAESTGACDGPNEP